MAEKETQGTDIHEQAVDVEQFGEIAHERHEAIHNALELAERKHKARHSEREILAEARELAKEVEDSNKERQSQSSPAEKRRGPITKKQLNSSFKSQITYAQNEMTTTEKFTSRVIHSKPVDKTADFIGSTIARPNAMLSGSIAAFGGITIFYFISKYYGFQLSGFETIGAFIIGWIAGILYDYFALMIRGHK